MEGRRLFSLTGEEYRYKGKEIGAFLEKDPASVTGYFRRGEDLQSKKKRLIFCWTEVEKDLNN